MLTGMCPECDALVHFTSMPEIGHRLVCPDCRSRLIVLSSNPIKLDWAFVEPIEAKNPRNRRELPNRSG